MSETVVKMLADQPWCALVATHSSATAVHSECRPPANPMGTTRHAHVSMVASRADFSGNPNRIYPLGSHPPVTLPIVDTTYTTISGSPICERSSLNRELKYPG